VPSSGGSGCMVRAQSPGRLAPRGVSPSTTRRGCAEPVAAGLWPRADVEVDVDVDCGRDRPPPTPRAVLLSEPTVDGSPAWTRACQNSARPTIDASMTLRPATAVTMDTAIPPARTTPRESPWPGGTAGLWHGFREAGIQGEAVPMGIEACLASGRERVDAPMPCRAQPRRTSSTAARIATPPNACAGPGCSPKIAQAASTLTSAGQTITSEAAPAP
jgi:hypothetical protein